MDGPAAVGGEVPLDGPAVGDAVPAFTLENQFGERVSDILLGSADYFLVFYPFAFSRVCTSELAELELARADFAERGVRLFGISTDHKHALRAYAHELGIGYELLADFWPHGAAAQAFGCFDPEHGRAGRSTFLVSGGRIAARFDSAPGVARGLDSYRAALAALAAP